MAAEKSERVERTKVLFENEVEQVEFNSFPDLSDS